MDERNDKTHTLTVPLDPVTGRPVLPEGWRWYQTVRGMATGDGASITEWLQVCIDPRGSVSIHGLAPVAVVLACIADAQMGEVGRG